MLKKVLSLFASNLCLVALIALPLQMLLPGIEASPLGAPVVDGQGQLPVSILGVVLVIVAFVLFILEVFVTSFGILTAVGLLSLIAGLVILFSGGAAILGINPWLIVVMAIIVVGFLAFAITRIVQIHRRQPTTGSEELVGKTATARTALKPEGFVFLEGERWSATSESGDIEPGEEVTINRVDGLKLYVIKSNKEVSQ